MDKLIVITTTSFAQDDMGPLTVLKDNGFQFKSNPYKRKMVQDEIVKLCKGTVGMIAGTETLDAATLEKLPTIRVISRCGAGLENIDLQAASQLGIKVFNTPDAPTLAVAELTVGLILSLLRNVCSMNNAVRGGVWEKVMGANLAGKRVGIIGFGRIGRKVAQLLKGLGCELAYCDPAVDDKMSAYKRMEMSEILEWSDIISIHAAVKNRIIGVAQLRLMKKGAWLVNTSRGEAVDEEALYAALKDGHLSGAALDVFGKEPYNGPFGKLNNIILTPHIGSYARESRIAMEMQAVANLLKGFGIR